MGTMDFIIIGAVALFALIGLIKGGAKIFFGLFMLLIIMVGASFLSAFICPYLLQKKTADGGAEYTSIAQTLMSPISNALPADGDISVLLDTEIVLGEDGVLYIGKDGDIPMVEAVSQYIPVIGQYLASFLSKAAVPGTTLRTSISYMVALYIAEIVLWVILVTILAIIRNIVRKKIFRYLDDEKNGTQSKIDRLIGLVLNVVIIVAVFWGVGLLVAHFDDGANWANSADAFFLNGVVSGPFMKANPLLKLMGITLPVGA